MIYVFHCENCGDFELYLKKPVVGAVCSVCGRIARRNYKAERAGLPPFKAYWTEALFPERVYVDSRSTERKFERQTGFRRIR